MIVFLASINADFVEQTPTQVSCRSKAGQLAGFRSRMLDLGSSITVLSCTRRQAAQRRFRNRHSRNFVKEKTSKNVKTNSGGVVVSMDGVVCRCLLPLLSMERLQMREKRKIT